MELEVMRDIPTSYRDGEQQIHAHRASDSATGRRTVVSAKHASKRIMRTSDVAGNVESLISRSDETELNKYLVQEKKQKPNTEKKR